MPGPLAKNRTRRPDTGSTDKHARKRIARRESGFSASNDKYRAGFHHPGSENRKKG